MYWWFGTIILKKNIFYAFGMFGQYLVAKWEHDLLPLMYSKNIMTFLRYNFMIFYYSLKKKNCTIVGMDATTNYVST